MPASNNPPKFFIHAYHCCCHFSSCLSHAFCGLKLLIYSYFLPGTLHLICDEGIGAGDKMFPYYAYIKQTFFQYNVCMRMKCPWLRRHLSAVFPGKTEKQLSIVGGRTSDYCFSLLVSIVLITPVY